MKLNKVIKIAIRCVEYRMKVLAVDYHLAKDFKATSELIGNRAKEYEELLEVKQELEKML